MNKVLIIESDEDPSGPADALQALGITVFKEQQSGNGLRTMVDVVPQLIILEENMPPLDGIELLPLMNRFTDSLIIIKGEGRGLAAPKAMLQGADLYFDRWVTEKEILAHVRALLRRRSIESEELSTKKRREPGNAVDRELSHLK